MTHPRLAAAILAPCAILARPGPAQTPPAPSPAQTPAQTPAGQPAPSAIADMPPALRLGFRVDQVRRRLAVAPVVVIVQDVSSYVDAIGAWRLTARFPVLLDDGTPQARENIARFVRAFKPAKVLRWACGRKTVDEFTAKPPILDQALGLAWTPDGKAPDNGFDHASILAQWKTLGLAPPGVVVAATDDPAWPAALALAAGRGQPIFWSTSTRKLDNPASEPEVDAFCASLEAFCERTALPWKGLGDTLDAVTLCTAAPQTYKSAGRTLATTDRVGRTGPTGGRWAWTGQIFGRAAPAAYRAMAALFLTSERRAWIFDSYPDAPGWNAFDGRKAEDILKQLTWTSSVIGKPDGNLDHWRSAARAPVDAAMILVNTKGEKDAFHLAAGTGRPADLPLLARPALVHFVHSYSAQFVGTRDTIAGRWLDRGAYAYAGSVDEPGLEGFTPTPAVAGQLAAQFPFAAAVRDLRQPVWKITVIGDPLATFGPTPPAAPIPSLPGAVDLAEEVRSLLKSDLPLGVWTLVMLGRDEDAARLGAAMATGPAESLNADAALPAALALFRTGKLEDFRALTARLKPADLAKLPEVADARALAGGR